MEWKKKEEWDNYFIILKSENNLLDKSECTYNVDGSGVPLEYHSPLEDIKYDTPYLEINHR